MKNSTATPSLNANKALTMKLYFAQSKAQYQFPSDDRRYCGTGNFGSTSYISITPLKGEYAHVSELEVSTEVFQEVVKYLTVIEKVGTGIFKLELGIDKFPRNSWKSNAWFDSSEGKYSKTELELLDGKTISKIDYTFKTIPNMVEEVKSIEDRVMLTMPIHYSYTPKAICVLYAQAMSLQKIF